MNKTLSILWAVALVVLIFLAQNVLAQDKGEEAKSRIVKATIFKNGTALVRQEIKGVTDKDGYLRCSNIAPPIIGTFSAISGEVDRVVLEEFETVAPITTLPDLLEENIGKTILIAEVDKEGKKTYRAEKITAVLKRDEETPAQPSDRSRFGYYPYPPPLPGKLVVLQSDLGTRIVSVSNFGEFMAQSGQEIVTTKKEKKTRLAIHLANSAGKESTVTVEYLTRGLRWIPTYRMALVNKDTVELSLSAEVVNDIIDLNNTAVEFVGGFPHFLFDGQLSPIALSPFWPAFSQFIAPSGRGDVYAGNIASQGAIDRFGMGGPPDSVLPGLLQTLPGVSTAESGDLHFYLLPELTLPKNKRGKFVLWQTTAPYENLYVLEVDVAREKKEQEERERQRSSGAASGITSEMLAKKLGRAWYALSLKNTGKIPWTMGPAIAFQNERPLGQDIIYFTAPDTETLFYIAPSPQITYQYSEEVTDRVKNALQLRHYNCDLIKEKGTLKIRNSRAEAIKLKLSFDRGGEITETDNSNLSITKMEFDPADWGGTYGGGPYELNLHSKVSGTLSLKPGEEITIIMSRQYYHKE
jgi:hypothetical protein